MLDQGGSSGGSKLDDFGHASVSWNVREGIKSVATLPITMAQHPVETVKMGLLALLLPVVLLAVVPISIASAVTGIDVAKCLSAPLNAAGGK